VYCLLPVDLVAGCTVGKERVVFLPYTTAQLRAIIEHRLRGQRTTACATVDAESPECLFEPDVILYAAKKIAAASSDARRALHLYQYVPDHSVSKPVVAASCA
jgi:Cdc6-like AAA superfamily ATPase